MDAPAHASRATRQRATATPSAQLSCHVKATRPPIYRSRRIELADRRRYAAPRSLPASPELEWKVIGTGSAQSNGGGIGVGEYSATLEVDRAPRAGARCTLEVFGDNPGSPDEGPSSGFNTRRVKVIVFPDLAGWLLYRVEPGDTLSEIVRKLREFGRFTVSQIVAANPRVTDPDHIEVGWRLRIPLKA